MSSPTTLADTSHPSLESLHQRELSNTQASSGGGDGGERKCQQNSPISRFFVLERCFPCLRLSTEAISSNQMLKLNRRIAAIKPSATLAADARATEMKLAGIDVVSLAAGEPDFDTPERIKDAARRALQSGATKYTPVGGTAAMKKAIAEKLKRENGLEFSPAEIIACAGAKQAEANVIGALFDVGDEVIIPTPAWVSFSAMVELSGAKPVFVPCPEAGGFMLEPDALRRAITPRTRGIMLNSPSNPTGAVYGAEQLAAIG